MTTSYDRLLYPTDPQDFASPARLAALARLCGLAPSPARGYAMLEIGCGDGVNLLACALEAPESRFFGFDLAESAIGAARDLAMRARLAQASFACRDILDHGLAPGSFDYIVAHGVYAWVPEEAQRATLDLIAGALTPDGLAVVSANILPGCALRAQLRERMRAEIAAIEDPPARIAAARALLRRLDEEPDRADPAAAALADEARTLLAKDPAILFHDDLAEVWGPTRFDAFAAACDAAGLDIVCDADPASLAAPLRAASASEATGAGWRAAEQARDENEGTRFRRFVLCRAGRAGDRRFAPDRLRGLFAFGEFAVQRSPAGVELRTPAGGRIATQDRAIGEFLIELARAFPRGFSLDPYAGADDARVDTLLSLVFAGAVALRSRPQAFTLTPGEVPRASPLARAQIAAGRTRLASLRGGAVDVEEKAMRDFLALCDGRRDRAALAREMGRQMKAQPLALARAVDSALADAARMGLIMA
jgi:hypothetical protein